MTKQRTQIDERFGEVEITLIMETVIPCNLVLREQTKEPMLDS